MTKRRETLWKIVKVIYFLITIPVVALLIFLVKDNHLIPGSIPEGGRYQVMNLSSFFALMILIVLGYVLLTLILRKVIDYISTGEFERGINYKKLFSKFRYLLLFGVLVLCGLFYFGRYYHNQIRNYCRGEGDSLSKAGICSYLTTDREDTNNQDDEWPEDVPSNAIEGDFDGDGASEYMWLSTYIDEDTVEGSCYIHFSKRTIPIISVEGCIGGTPVNEGDLNLDGADEIGLFPERFVGCRGRYHVWHLRKGKRKYLVPSISTHCSQQEQCHMKTGKDCDWISPSTQIGEVKTYSSVFTDDGIFGQTNYVPLE